MRIFFFEISRKLTSASEPASYTYPVGARQGIRGESFGWSFHKKNYGSQNCAIPGLNTWEFSAFFEISRKLTSASDPVSYTCPLDAEMMIRRYLVWLEE